MYYIRGFLIITGILLMVFFGGKVVFLELFGDRADAAVDQVGIVKDEKVIKGKARQWTGEYYIESVVAYHFWINQIEDHKINQSHQRVSVKGSDTHKILVRDKKDFISPGSKVKIRYFSHYPKLNGIDQKGTAARTGSYSRFFLGLVILLWGIINPKIPVQTNGTRE